MLTNREQFFKKHNIPIGSSLSMDEIAKLSKMPIGALQEVYNRGVGAWKTNIESVRIQGSFKKNPDTTKYPRGARLIKEQWGYARVYAFVNKTDSVFRGADYDIAKKYKLV